MVLAQALCGIVGIAMGVLLLTRSEKALFRIERRIAYVSLALSLAGVAAVYFGV